MPTNNGKARILLKNKKAKVVTVKPFTIQLNYETTEYTQKVTLGVKCCFENVGFSAVSDKKELISGETKLLEKVSSRITDRAMYRRNRRQRLRYRKPKFKKLNNGKSLETKRKAGWIAPSIKHKLDTFLRFIEKLCKILPVNLIVAQAGKFDSELIDASDFDFNDKYMYNNVRHYVLQRDRYKCQNPGCKNKDTQPKLEIHHIIFRRNGGSNRVKNLITLCTKCHTNENHNGFLLGWQPNIKSFKECIFAAIIRKRLIEALKSTGKRVRETFGSNAKTIRFELNLAFTDYNDAFCIAYGKNQRRCKPLYFIQTRRNNRSLEKWYDAKYIDIRSGDTIKAAALNCGREVRNKSKNNENLRVYRGLKVSKGRRSIRTQRYFYQPNDLVKCDNKIYRVAGTQSKGRYVKLHGRPKLAKPELLSPYRFSKGLVCM